MLKRVLLILLTLVLAIASLLLAAKHPTGPNTIAFDEPLVFMIAIGIVVFLFIPPFVMSFFSNSVVRINIVYQFFIVLSFLGLVPLGFMVANGALIAVVSIIGLLVSVASIVVLIREASVA
ncbi:putative integral inner membrane protein [Fictibacillus macauensis ZFHKF-1]|uniref:Putative integral inner membrane protein n=1 Tax=Fictibacillus macauensis ZFHKF-1 TaxID=1196324 RepID=I8UBT4_9BACL|nr:hypothetical protein [Fictibacillus macauensis]EIT84258.1 putative integral inner membrane protein [Fictibacillus macauensis ZFHKF-1]